MSSFNLTRMVTMSPFFSLLNKSSYELEVGEVSSPSSTRWHYVPSAEVSLHQGAGRNAVVVEVPAPPLSFPESSLLARGPLRKVVSAGGRLSLHLQLLPV